MNLDPTTMLLDAEELRADAELRQAMEQIVEQAAVSVWSGIVQDAQDIWIRLISPVVQWWLPLVYYYQEEPSRMREDLLHVGLYLILWVLAILFLAPRRRSPHPPPKHSGNSSSGGNSSSSSLHYYSHYYYHCQQPQQQTTGTGTQATPHTENHTTEGTNNANNHHGTTWNGTWSRTLSEPSSSPRQTYYYSSWFGTSHTGTASGYGETGSNDSAVSERDEGTEEDRFEREWLEWIASSEYYRLVLPPNCRRVVYYPQSATGSVAAALRAAGAIQPTHTHATTATTTGILATNNNPNPVMMDATATTSEPQAPEEEDPAVRLQTYLRHLLWFLRALISYDYTGAGWTLILWLQGIRKQRKTNSVERLPDLDDVVSVADSSDVVLCDTAMTGTAPPLLMEGQGGSRLLRSPLTTPTKRLISWQLSNHIEEMEQEPSMPLLEDGNRPCATIRSNQPLSPTTVATVPEMGTAAPEQVLTENEMENVTSHQANNPTSENSCMVESPRWVDPKGEWEPIIPAADNDVPSSPTTSQSFFFETASTKDSLKQMMVDVAVPDKNGYIVGDHLLPDSRYTPLLVFVNSRSGPQQGHLLVSQLRRLLNPIQVWDLAQGNPEIILESFSVFSRLQILVCGGDGTVSWIISSLEKMKLRRKWPPIAILPLGTGNDLARVHGWGGGYNNESLTGILKQISESYISMLDRWEVTISYAKKHNSEVKSFFNYLGVGADAQAALQVHYLRNSRPDWFFSRLINKAWYGVFGAEDIIKASSVNVRKEIKLFADGVEIPLPHDSQGIIILNIDSYAGGVPLWSHGVKSSTPPPRRSNRFAIENGRCRTAPRRTMSMYELNRNPLRRSNSLDSVDDSLRRPMSEEERYALVTACDRPSSCQDGLLEIVSIRGAFHLGQIKVGLSNAQCLCQCREATVVIKNKMAVQVDGEPWRQLPCTLRISRKKESAAMLHRSMDDGGVETEMSKLLDWAEERNLIDGHVHSILLKEFSRRIENKTRQRRVRPKDNFMSTIKRAISTTKVSNLQTWETQCGSSFS